MHGGVAVRFKILGHIEAEREGRSIDIGPYKQRSLLALLLINANRIVATDRLIDQLWGESGSRDKQNVLWVHISNLRHALQPNRDEDRDSIIATSAPGYVLRVEPGSVDSQEFESLLQEGRALLAEDPAAASLVLSNALALWRGLALEDFVYEDWAQPEIRRLTDLRLQAVEARIDADLARGMTTELVSELESLTLQNPLDEHLVSQLMVAQYRCGRQADALRSYASFRTHLGDELGIEPSPALRQLEDRILIADSALLSSLGSSPGGLAPGLAIRGYELREEIAASDTANTYRAYQPAVGREVVVKVAKPELANDPEFVRIFEARARLVASLEHPHIVPLHDYWREPDAAYLVMPFMRHGSLARRLTRGELGEDEADRTLRQVVEGLAAAHRRGMVHSNLKPSNILLDEDDNAYLSDFKLVDGAAAASRQLDPAYASPEQLRGETPTTASDVYSLAKVIRESGMAIGPAISVLDRALSEDPADRFSDGNALLAALEGRPLDIPRVGVATGVRNPYKGLHAFEQDDAEDFYGRDRTVERLVSHLGHPGTDGRFLSVVGPSGCGKTSVVKAGLIPALQSGALPGSETWFAAEMVPAPHPFEELADALDRISTRSRPGLVDSLMSDPKGLRDELESILPDDQADLVLIVDQFEELFTQTDEDEASRFIAAIVEAARSVPSRLRVVITLRADFYDRPLGHPLLGDLIRDSTAAITPMSPDELERAIQGPAERVGVRFDQGLVALLIRDIAERPGSLPLLQYTLTELFEQRTGALISTPAYNEMGGISASLANRANAVFSSLSRSDQDLTRQVFLHLVTLGEGEADTRRRMRVSQLADLVPLAALDHIINEFGRHRLLTFDRDNISREPTVEIAHEALLRDWPDLRLWIAQSRDDVRLARRLETAATEWADADRDPGYLLRGTRLTQAERFLEESSVAISPLVSELLEASSSTQREERLRRHRLRNRITAGFGVAALIASILAILALLGQHQASEAAELARSKELALAATSSEVVSQDPELSLLLAIQSATIAEPSIESMASLHSAVAQQRTVFTYTWPTGQEQWVVGGDINRDGTALVAAGVFGDYVEVVSTSNAERLWAKEFEHRRVTGAYFMNTDNVVIVGVAPDPSQGPVDEASVGLFVLDAKTGEQIHHQAFWTCGAYLPEDPSGVSNTKAVLFALPDTDCSRRSLPLGSFPVAYVFDAATNELLPLGVAGADLAVPQFPYSAFSGDGTIAAFQVGNSQMSYRDSETGEPLRPGVEEWNRFVALNQDGSQTITGAFEPDRLPIRSYVSGEATVFDSWSGEAIASFDGHETLPAHAIFSRDGETAYSIGSDGIVRAWDPRTGLETFTAPGGLEPRALALSEDGTHLLIFDASDKARVLDLTPEAAAEVGSGRGTIFEWESFVSDDGAVYAVPLFPPPYFGFAVSTEDSEPLIIEQRYVGLYGSRAFVPQSHRLILAWPNQMFLVDGDSLTIVEERSWEAGGLLPSEALTVSPDGRFVAGTYALPYLEGGRPSIEVIGLPSLERLLVIEDAHAGTITDLEVSQNGELIASGSLDEWARVWSSSDGSLVHAIQAPGPVRGVEFAEGDRHLVVTLKDATTYEYTLDPIELLDIARSRLSRGFTDAECVSYGLDPCPTLEDMLQS